MEYGNLSKDELISKIEKLELDLIKSNSINNKLENAEDIATQQNSILRFINSMAIPLADKSSVDEFSKILLKAVKDYTGAVLATFSLYQPDKKELLLLHVEAEQGILKTAIKIAGEKIVNTASPVDDETYKLIIKNQVCTFNTFTEVSFGAIPTLIDKAIRTATGIDRLYPIAHVIEGELYGTTMIAFKKGQISPSIELLESYAHLMSVSLRRYNAEKALENSEIKYRTYIEHAPLGIIIANDKGKYINVNPEACLLLGYTQDELLKLSIPDVLVDEKDIDSFQKLKEVGKISYEIKLKKKDGTVVIVRLDAVLLPNNQFIAFHDDITERKLAEYEIAETKQFYENIIEGVQDGIWVTDENDVIYFANAAMEQIAGIPREKIQGNNVLKDFPEDTTGELVPFYNRAKEEKKPIWYEIKVKTPTGKNTWQNGWLIPKYETDIFKGIICTIRDITVRRQTEAELKEKSEFIDKIIDSSALSTWISDEHGTAIRVNPACLDFFGATEEEVIGKYNIFKDSVLEKLGFIPDIQKVFEKGEVANLIIDYNFAEVDHVSVKNATHKIANSIFTPILDINGKVSNVIVQTIDLSEIKKAEKIAIEEKNKAQQYLDIADVMLLSIDTKGTVLLINPKGCEILGYSKEEILGQNWFDLALPEDQREIVKEVAKKVFSREIESVSYYENNIVTKTGKERLIAFHNSVLTDENGNIIGTLSSGEDITERKQAEDALNKSQRTLLSSLESMADAVFISDINGNFIQFNEAFATFHRIKDKSECYEALKEWPKIIEVYNLDGSVLPLDRWVVNRAINGEKSSNEEYIIKRKDTGEKWYGSYNFSPIRDDEGTIIGSVTVARDITASKKTEAEIIQNNANLNALIENTNDSIWSIDKDYKLLTANSVFLEDVEPLYNERLSIGSLLLDKEKLPPELYEEWKSNYDRALSGNNFKTELETNLQPDNKKFLEVSYNPIINDKNEVAGVSIIGRDITERKQAEAKIQAAEENLQNTFDLSPGIIAKANLKTGYFIEANQAVSKILGYTFEEFTSIPIMELIHPDDRYKAVDEISDQLAGKVANYHENRYLCKDGSYKWISWQGTIADKNGIVTAVGSDITDRKLAEFELVKAKEAAEENEEKFRLLHENAGLGIGYISPDGIVISFNTIAAKDMNGAPEDFAGKSIFDIFPKAAADTYFERLQKAINSHKIEDYEDFVELPNHKKWFLSTYTKIVDAQNKVLGVQIISQDITEIRKAESELKIAKEKAEENEEKFKLLNHLTSEMLLLPDMESIYKFISETLRKYYPNSLVVTVSIDEAIQKAKIEAVSGLENSLIKKIIKISGFNPFEKTFKLIDYHVNYYKSGDFVEFNGGVAKFAGPEFPAIASKTIEKLIGVYKIYSIGINKDDELLAAVHFLTYNKQVIAEGNFIEVFVKQAGLILQKKVNEKALKNAKNQAEASNANITAIIEGTNSSIWAFNRSYELLYINNTFQQEFLQSFGVLLQPGMNLVEALPEMLQPFWKPRYDRVLNNEQFTIEDAVPTDIGTLYIEVSFNPIVKNGQVIGGSCFGSNITSRKLAELELQKAKEKAEESEMQLKLIADNFVNGMIYQVAMLDENRRQFNYISKNIEELYGCTMQEAKEDANLIYGKIHPDDINGLIEKEKEALKNMSVFETEARTIMPDGNIRWAYYISKPRLINGIVCWDGIEIDITERKQMELELVAAKEKAEESDRLKSAFLANMSHEIRTPMNGILGFTSLLKEPGLTGKDQQKFIDIIEKSGDRMLNTINDIINISKIEAGQVDVKISDINVNKQMDELFEFFLPEAKKKNIHLSVTKKIADGLANIKSDEEKINSVLTNFIKNAVKYTHSGSIEFGYYIKENGAQNELEFYVKDTGIGIPKERQNAVFNRFVQADIEDRQVYEGSGLGLAISKAYVEMLGGKIWVESEEGVGSQFYFTIPYETKNREIPKKSTEDSNKQLLVKKNLKALIADDDEFAITYLTIVMKDYAEEMLIAKTGIEAVEMCRDNPGIDIVLMDIKIPGINGYEATRQIREFNKEVFILAQTAYAQMGDREKAIEAGCDDYISKPINKEKLLEIISNRF